MKLPFHVHSVRKGHVAIDAVVNDKKQRVLADGMEVELTSENGRSLTLPFYGEGLREAEMLFESGKTVYVSIGGE